RAERRDRGAGCADYARQPARNRIPQGNARSGTGLGPAPGGGAARRALDLGSRADSRSSSGGEEERPGIVGHTMKQMIRPIAILLTLSGTLAAQSAPQPAAPANGTREILITMPGSPFGIAAGFLYGYQNAKPYTFMPELRRLGADFTKIYLFWNQVEP